MSNNVRLFKGKISTSVGYPSGDGQCELHSGLAYLKAEGGGGIISQIWCLIIKSLY
jgi:hypothetical protein